MPGIGPSAVDRGDRSASRPAGRPGFSAYPLDRGIRPASNAGSGDPSEVADGEVKAHLGNPGCYDPSDAPAPRTQVTVPSRTRFEKGSPPCQGAVIDAIRYQNRAVAL